MPLSTKTVAPLAASANPTKEKAKPHVAAGTNSPSTTNEKRMTIAQRNLLKREQSKPEHKAPKPNSELGMNSLHRNTADYIPVNRGSRYAPPQRIPKGVRRGVGEG